MSRHRSHDLPMLRPPSPCPPAHSRGHSPHSHTLHIEDSAGKTGHSHPTFHLCDFQLPHSRRLSKAEWLDNQMLSHILTCSLFAGRFVFNWDRRNKSRQRSLSGVLPACLSTAQSPVSCFPSKIPRPICASAFRGHTHPSTPLKLIRFFVEEIF